MKLYHPLSSPDELVASRGVSPEAGQLRQELERLLLITEAVWTILEEKLGVTEADLVREMVKIDMRDGKLDGRVAPGGPTPCPSCQRTLFKHRPRCLYCGELIPPRPFNR